MLLVISFIILMIVIVPATGKLSLFLQQGLPLLNAVPALDIVDTNLTRVSWKVGSDILGIDR